MHDWFQSCVAAVRCGNLIHFYSFYIDCYRSDHFSSSGRATHPLCVCVCLCVCVTDKLLDVTFDSNLTM